MITRTCAILVVAAALAVPVSPAAQTGTTGNFRFERSITPAGPGPARLAIDVPLLVASAERATDLRLFDSADHEVPFLLVRPSMGMPLWRRGSLLPIASAENGSTKTSGFEADLGDIVAVDRFRVRGLPPGFLKRFMLEGSGDRGHWTLLIPEGTLFDLPDEHLQQLELPFKAGEYRYLRVTWDDSNSGKVPLPGSAEARKVPDNAPPEPLRSPVTVERRPSEPGRSRYLIRLPGPHLPIVAVVLDVTADHVLREAEVSESRLSGLEAAPSVLGHATLRRAVYANIAASDLRIPIDAPTEPVLDLTIEDGDNPPLTLNGAVAEFGELPWIYFESDGSPLVARYGGTNRQTPRYDLEAIRPTLRIDEVMDARWGEPRSLAPADVNATAAPSMPIEGAPIDLKSFRRVRDIPAGDAGLVALQLDTAVLAESNGPARSFSDVRIVDPAGRQVPYLVERRGEPLALDLKPTPSTSKAIDAAAGHSIYRLHLPYVELPQARLVLTTDARVFDRAVQVGVERPPDRQRRDPWFDTLVTARWLQADQDRPASALQLALPPVNANDLLLVVDEGDNRTLSLSTVRLLLPSYRLRFYRQAATPLKLAYGRDDLTSPKYDLALLAPQVLGVNATEVTAGPIAAPASAVEETSKLGSPVIFWSVLGAAVLVLLWFVVKLVRRA